MGIFSTSKKIGDTVFKNNNTTLYKTTVNNLKTNYNCVNWNKNRPHDPVRIKDIKNYFIEKQQTVIPGIIYGWKNEETIEIYDGIHRLLAGFETDPNMELLIQVYSTVDEKLIIEDFKNLNKSISVPTIYIQENNYYKRTVCENVVKHFCEKYPKHVSASRNCQTQNFNRDLFIEFISKLNIDFSRKALDTIIIQELSGINFQAKDYVKKHKVDVPQKSHCSNFYLFFLQELFIKDKLEISINRDYV